MRLHILGICGTFMGGLALIARELGHEVSGCDSGVYPPMSTMLAEAGIRVHEGFSAAALAERPDLVVIGNALSRGNPAVEHVLNERLRYVSGPQWLADQVLAGRRVAAIAGTHGKTTTTAMTAFILERAGLAPGYLVGGLPPGFGRSAHCGAGEWFVIEADEYDTAFFDKRSKFVHYRPEVLLINNLEYDHADIFPDLAAIQRQLHHCVRTVPGRGLILRPAHSEAIDGVLAEGCWSPVATLGHGGHWQAEPLSADAGRFELRRQGRTVGVVDYALFGLHNAANACAAAAICHHLGVGAEAIVAALNAFEAPSRRLQALGEHGGLSLFDDFAHHPTAIAHSLASLRARFPGRRLIAVLEPRSNTMRMGIHRETLARALDTADLAFVYEPPRLGWDLRAALAPLGPRCSVHGDHEGLLAAVAQAAAAGDVVVTMSNGDFGGMPRRLIERLGASDSGRAPGP